MSSKEVDSPNYLYDLCDEKKWNEVREYLKRSYLSNEVKEQQIYWKTKQGSTTFSKACYEKAPIDIIESMISIAGNEIIHIASNNNLTPLHRACYPDVEVNVDIMNLLVQIGGKKLVMERTRTENATALHYACLNEIIDVADIKPMVDIGGKELVLEQSSKFKNTCLHVACLHRPTPDALKLLLNVGKKDLLISRNTNGNTPFQIALEYADNHGPQGLQVFVDAGEMELLLYQGQTPLSLIKGLESSNQHKPQEWKDFFRYFDEKLSREVLKVREVARLNDENEKTITSLQNEVSTLESNIKKLEDKKKSHAKVIESLETRLKKLEKDNEDEKIDHKNAIQVLQTENAESKETIRSLQAEKDGNANTIASLEMENESDENLIFFLKFKIEKAKKSIQSLQAEKEGQAELIQTLRTKKEEIRIEKENIVKELKVSFSSEQEKDKKIESLESESTDQREDITVMQLKLDETKKKMKVMKRKIEELETTSKEESSQVKSKRSRFFFW